MFLNKHFLFPIGFRYGSDIVPFSKVDEDQMKYKHDGKCFAVLGFTKQEAVRGCPADGALFKRILQSALSIVTISSCCAQL